MVTAAMKIKNACLLLGRKSMTNLDSILKSRDITLPTKVHIIKDMVFPALWWLMVTFSKRAYAEPRSAAPRAPAPAAVHC